MNQYFATFPAGTFGIIARHLKSFKLDELKIIEHDDSSVVFAAALPIEKLIELRYFTNVYLVVDENPSLPSGAIKGKHFRLMRLKDGSPQPMDPAERTKLQARIQRDFDLVPHARFSKTDFYVIERSSGKKLFTLRLSRAKFKRETISGGELRPELAHILCLAAGVKAKHMVVDMFAGYGAIPLEAVRGFGCKHVVAVDKQKFAHRHEHPPITWHEQDSQKLDFIPDASVDRVVTDPPWGAYDSKVVDLPALYDELVKEVLRILKPDGVAVVLTGFAGAEQRFGQATGLKLIGTWPILVSGKKATIYKLQKARQPK